MSGSTSKTCSRCSRRRAAGHFSRKAAAPDGLQGHCKDCAREYGTRWARETRRLNGAETLAERDARRRRDAAATQAAVLAAVRAVWARTGRPPVLAEVARGAGFEHVSSVQPYLARLEALGEIERDAPGGHLRTIWPAGARARIRALLGDS